jgi:CheY-like chemotaxis protein
MTKPVILWAEDSEDDVLLVQRAFRRAELSSLLVRVADGNQATDYLTRVGPYANSTLYPRPQLLLLDVKMPRRSGLEVLAWKQTRPELQDLPAVILSSSGQKEDIEEAYRLGAQEYLIKPSKLEDLVTLMKDLHMRWMSPPR